MRNFIYMIAILLLLTSLSVPAMAEKPSGIIKGKVTNKTLNGKGMDGIEVILHQQVKGKESESGRSRTDQTGSFVFEGVNLVKEAVYYTSGEYRGLSYYSKGSHLHGKAPLSLDLEVYEPTENDKQIHVNMHHIFFELDQGGSLKAKELMIVENQGNTVYIGTQNVKSGKRETLKVSLPKEASGIQYIDPLMPCCVVETEEGFTDTMEIRPGTKKVSFSYTIDTTGSSYAFIKGISLDTDHINFIIPNSGPNTGIKVISEQLEIKESTVKSGQSFYHLSGKTLNKGARIVVELSGLPWMKSLYKWIIIGLVILLVGTGLAIPFLNRQKQQDKNGLEKKPSHKNLTEERRILLQAIAELDDLSEYGEIDPDEYQTKRNELLKKATELTKKTDPDNDSL